MTNCYCNLIAPKWRRRSRLIRTAMPQIYRSCDRCRPSSPNTTKYFQIRVRVRISGSTQRSLWCHRTRYKSRERILDYSSINAMETSLSFVIYVSVPGIIHCEWECKCRLAYLICYIEKIIESLSTLNESLPRYSHYDIPMETTRTGGERKA